MSRRLVVALSGASLAGLLAVPALDALAQFTATDPGPPAVSAGQGAPAGAEPHAPAQVVPAQVVPAKVVLAAADPVPAAPSDGVAATAPTPEPAPAELVVIDPSTVDDDADWVGPPEVIPDCDTRMVAAGIDFVPSRLPVHKTRGGIYCGAEQVIRYRKGPGAISWGGSPKVTCPVALGMARLEAIVQEEAERHLGRKVRRIQHMGTYNCREMANYPGWVSEHSYANAIDIKHFELTNGKTIPVLGTYPKNGAEPKNASARFLKAVARRLYDERVFSVVLTPSFDGNHRNHFHLDMARYLVDGT